MLDTTYTKGYVDALEHFGLFKEASVLRKAPLLTRAGRWFGKKMPTKQGVKEFLIGKPRQFGEEIVEGKALGKRSLIRQGLESPTLSSKAFMYGLPAFEASSIAFDEDPDKAKRIGEALGGAFTGMAAFKPLGLLGSIAAHDVGSRVGGLLGGTAGHVTGVGTAKKEPQQVI